MDRWTSLLCVAWLLPCLLGVLCAAAEDAPARLQNGDLEQIAENKQPMIWQTPSGFEAPEIIAEDPHGGQRAGRIAGDGKQRAWRQTVEASATRIYVVSGWFRAKDVRLDESAKDFARLYVHILYKDRPYAEATHVFSDLPSGNYGWRRFALRFTPKPAYPLAQIWVTAAAKLSSGALDFDDLALRQAEARGGWEAMEWANFARPVTLLDMGKAEPPAALTTRAKHGQWKTIPYEFGDKTGTMLWASEETMAPEVGIPLHAQGWHAVYLGLTDPAYLGCRALVRLSRDPAFVPRSAQGGNIHEVFFKAADLTGQSLHLAQCCDDECRPCGLAYVKLVPLTDAETAAVRADRADAGNRRLVTTIDGFSYIYSRRPVSRRALLEEVEVYRDTDFGTLILQMGGAEMVNYPSKIGEMIGQDLDDFPRPGDRRYAEALREMARRNINPTQTLIEGAHDVGMKVHVSIRPAAWVHSEPLSDFFRSRFYAEHPEWRCVDRDGTVVPRMSLAAPEVRRHLVDVLREAVGFGADGANVLFTRGAPFVLYEKPFCDLFQQRHGRDPKDLDEDAPEILSLRAEVVTAFLREIRAMLDEEAKRRGGARLELSANVLPTEADNLRFGVDVRTWAKEGLLDLVCPDSGAYGVRKREYDLAFFREVCAPRKVRFAPSFVTWRMPDLAEVVRKTAEFYEAGADGVTFWDGNSAAGVPTKWGVLSRLGHIEETAERVGEGAAQPVTVRLHKIGGVVVDGPYSPNAGY